MISVVLSIHHEWAERIYSGEKGIEVRRGSIGPDFAGEAVQAYLYETLPVGRITGTAVLVPCDGEIFAPEDLMLLTCCSEEEMQRYGGPHPRYSRIMDVRRGETATLADLHVSRAPMSWCYAYPGASA